MAPKIKIETQPARTADWLRWLIQRGRERRKGSNPRKVAW
jgi:hypothetical protein